MSSLGHEPLHTAQTDNDHSFLHSIVKSDKKLNDIALLNKSSQSYRQSLAILDHTQVNASSLYPTHTGRYSIYLLRRDERLS